MMNKYPKLRNAVEMENHARHSGVHAAGVLVTQEPVSKYCAVSQYSAQIDKKDAESLNLLKIDALGLRNIVPLFRMYLIRWVGHEKKTLEL
jgi:DNA polymerase III alpha subunit